MMRHKNVRGLVVLVLVLAVLDVVPTAQAGAGGCANPPCRRLPRGIPGPPGDSPVVEQLLPGDPLCPFGGVTIDGNPVCSGAESIVPFASGLPVALTEVLDLASTVGLVGFGSSGPGVIVGGVIDLEGGPATLLNFAYSMPRNATLRSLAAFFSSNTTVPAANYTVRVEVWTAPPFAPLLANSFTPTGVFVTMVFPTSSLLPGTNAHAITSANLFIREETRVLLVASETSTLAGGTSAIAGYVSAGLSFA